MKYIKVQVWFFLFVFVFQVSCIPIVSGCMLYKTLQRFRVQRKKSITWLSNISTVSLGLVDINIEQNMSTQLSGRRYYVSFMELHSKCLSSFFINKS